MKQHSDIYVHVYQDCLGFNRCWAVPVDALNRMIRAKFVYWHRDRWETLCNPYHFQQFRGVWQLW